MATNCWVLCSLPTSNLIYGNTIATLDYKDNRTQVADERLREDPEAESSYSNEKPVRFNPYPDYNSDEWKDQGYAPYVPCKGSTGEFIEDLLVFKGRPQKWPKEKIGTYSALQLDPNLCWERDTRLGPYGLTEQKKKIGGEYKVIDWDNVNWGDLQRRCVHKNAKRYDLNRSRKNPFLVAYPETAKLAEMSASAASSSLSKGNPAKGIVASSDPSTADALNRENIEEYGAGNLVDSDLLHDTKPHRRSADQPSEPRLDSASTVEEDQDAESTTSTPTGFVPEKRTALLLRSYTGKEFTDNDKQVIRALVSELSLKSGGEYEVFLLTHVKDPQLRIFDDPETYQYVLQENVPPEFHGMTVLWNDEVVWNIYTELTDENEKSVHTAQWLSVQKFSHDHPQFDFIWNWEMDFRYIGHHYDLLEALGKFAAKQPRRGLWERNERYYVPEFHGGYDTDYRKFVEKQVGEKTVWGPPKDLPFINPVGPKAPVADPGDDNYEWGVGEDADVITVGPIFNPIHSNWIIGNHIWGYNDSTHDSLDIPRRTTIVTQSRVSKRLLDIMHVENKRGNHVASEMTPQTVALLHGLKAVFAPHPVFMDRDWDGEFVEKWFNGGENGTCSGRGSPMGWGRERRYQGTTWYYRAEPPNRLYNNWMGWSDTDIGGKSWEEKNGRPCLPSVMLHQIKNTEPTEKDHRTGFDLTFG